MIRLTFYRPLTALEIREPTIEVCKEVAGHFGLYANFDQWQQPAFDGFASGPSKRKRIGNGKHNSWFINFQEEKLSTSKPTVVGRIALKAPFYEPEMQYGGFDYGKFGEVKPTYNFVTVHPVSEVLTFRPIDPDPVLLQKVQDGLLDRFVIPFPRLFNIEPFELQQSYSAH